MVQPLARARGVHDEHHRERGPGDERGAVFLPVYRTVYRLVDPNLPPGLVDTEKRPDWFSFPGRVGLLDPIVVPPGDS